MKQLEYKKRYDPEFGRYVRKHIYGEGIKDILKSIGSKLFNKTVKNTIKSGIQKGAEEALKKAAFKSGDYIAKKSGDKIVELLSKRNKDKPKVNPLIDTQEKLPQLSDYEINERINSILSGGKLRKL